ncbi:MAG: hypothetical protein Q4B22_09535, partial [Eubacteriales bacterium]|nr:hypothetical protein [Eubacteriales bacterium]
MTCEVCGKPITGNGRFCSSCGAPVKMRALEETVAMIEEEEETMAPVQNRGNEATGSYRMNASDLQEETRQTYGSQDRRSYGDQGRESYGSRDRQPYGDQNRQSYSSQSRQSYGDSDRQPYSSQSRQSYG